MARGTGKSGIEIAEEHVEALLVYLDARRGTPLPRYGSELNRTAIAKACGFDRQVFRTNPRCARIIEKADDADRIAIGSRIDQAQVARDAKEKVDNERVALEALNLRLMAENAALRRELERWRRLSALMARTGKLP